MLQHVKLAQNFQKKKEGTSKTQNSFRYTFLLTDSFQFRKEIN